MKMLVDDTVGVFETALTMIVVGMEMMSVGFDKNAVVVVVVLALIIGEQKIVARVGS